MGEWKEYKLGHLVEVKGGKRLPKGELLVDYDTDHPYIRVTDLGKKWVKKDGLQFVTTEIQKRISRYTVTAGDVILSIVGSIGFTGRISDELTGANLTENCVKFIAKTKDIDNDYLYYFLSSKTGQEEIDKRIVGSTQPKLPLYNIKDIDILIPPLPEQKSIASILGSLDDKIDLLHRQNKTLEALAETLFRQWFVEEAEEGWETTSLFDVIDLIGGGTPKTELAEYWGGDIKWISARDITPNHKGFITETEKKITELGLGKSSAKILPKYSTVISARGTVGKYCLLSEGMAFSQSNYGIKPKYKACYFFTYLLVANSVDELQAAAYGSVFDTITTNTFKEHRIQVPHESGIISFEKRIRPYFEKMLINCTQIRTLTCLRDTLLPKLMSGEVRVKEGLNNKNGKVSQGQENQ